ncbi:hypothetical protein M758_10G097400 [Ceratodon purpureus]|nr:hypothetical protein M758_10G097400 [Ceratodon purpureus]
MLHTSSSNPNAFSTHACYRSEFEEFCLGDGRRDPIAPLKYNSNVSVRGAHRRDRIRLTQPRTSLVLAWNWPLQCEHRSVLHTREWRRGYTTPLLTHWGRMRHLGPLAMDVTHVHQG